MRNNASLISSILFCLCLSNQLFSQEETKKHFIQAVQDVFQTELVYPQEKNEFQFTLPLTFQKSNNYNHLAIPITVEYGISDYWQVELEWNSFQSRYINSEFSAKGIGDMEIGTKYSFMNIGNSNFHTAIGFEFGIPLGDQNKELSEGLFEYEPYIILALDLPKWNNTQLFAQAAVSFLQQKDNDTDGEESETHELNLSAGFFIPFNRLIFTSEFNWYASYPKDEEENQFYYTPGLVWRLPGGWEAGIAVPIGLNNQSDTYRIIAMITYEFNIAGDDD